jgi:hypothetical protein
MAVERQYMRALIRRSLELVQRNDLVKVLDGRWQNATSW